MASKKIAHLNIWMNGELVGKWYKTGATEKLHYDESWIHADFGRPLSLSLPFTPGNQILSGDKVKHYFDNLLPDSDGIRRRLAEKFHAKSASPFDLLVELGRDCIGAIQLLPPDEMPENIHSIAFTPLNESQIANMLRECVSSTGLGQRDSDGMIRISLAGAQEKTAFLWHKEKWCIPKGATPTTHIFKLPLGLVGNVNAGINSVENEWLCSKIMAEFGLPVAHCDIRIFEDQKALVVERFDRKYSADNSWIIRLPQEDMCQAKGISPLRKYQSEGGLGITDCMNILAGGTNSLNDKTVFFKAQIIFWLLFAADGHSKNFSIKHISRNSYQLAPLYDVLSFFPIIGAGQGKIARRKLKMAMAVRGSTNYYIADKIQKKHFVNHATKVGFLPATAEAIITELIDMIESVITAVELQLPVDFDKELADIIFSGMRAQADKLSD